MKHLLVQYRVEFYENDFSGDSVFSFYTQLAPSSFAIGHFVEPRTWPSNPLPKDQHYKITAIEHLCSVVAKARVLHSLSICVKPVPRAKGTR